MRPKSLLLLTLALGCGLVASIGISQVLDRKGGRPQAQQQTEAIYIAKVDINLGDGITEELLVLEDWPSDKVPSGAIRKLENIKGRRPRTKIYKGEPILEAKLIAADAHDHPAQQVPPGYRVVSVRVSVHTGAAGLLRPGDRVDVQLYAKRDHRSGIMKTFTKTILKQIRVFAVDQEFRRASDDDESSPARTVSLVVTPEQADKLMLASRVGEINLTIRNPDDSSTITSAPANLEDLLDSSAGDPERERGTAEAIAQKATGLLSFLTAMRNSASSVPSQVAGAQMAAAPTPWTILILEGSDVREVQVSPDGPEALSPTDPARTIPEFAPRNRQQTSSGGQQDLPHGMPSDDQDDLGVFDGDAPFSFSPEEDDAESD